MNLCRACNQDFSSVEMFDRHRVGKHAYTYTEGIHMNPPREDGRRCLSLSEMREKGWERDPRGRWTDTSRHPGDRFLNTPDRSEASDPPDLPAGIRS